MKLRQRDALKAMSANQFNLVQIVKLEVTTEVTAVVRRPLPYVLGEGIFLIPRRRDWHQCIVASAVSFRSGLFLRPSR